MRKVGIKYCGGCNPYYDRVALVKRIERLLQGQVEFVSAASDDIDVVLAVEGCQTACADLASFQGKTIHVISRKEDADKLVQNLLNQYGIPMFSNDNTDMARPANPPSAIPNLLS